MPNYIRCNNTGKQWKELFIVEGNSASSGVRNASDPDTQAIFLLRGVVFNAVKKPKLADAMANREFHDLVTVLRCGIGDKFDINKLYFDRINLFTDADIDGFYISSGVLAFIYTHLRPLIEAGKVYKVYSPLYRLDCKDHEFVANKSELISVYYEKLVNIYKIKPESSDSFLSKSEMMEFLMNTYDYLENLINAAKESGKIDKFLVEMIGGYLTIYNVVNSEDDFISNDEAFSNQKFIKTIMSKIQKKYPEVKVDNNGRFSGIVNGHLAVIQTERRFYKKISRLIPVYKKYGLTLEVKERGKDKVTKMTIGEFLEASLKHQPSILHRFKGLIASPCKTNLIAGNYL